MIIRHNGIIYNNIFTSITWGGELTTSTRWLEVSYKTDNMLNFECGDKVELLTPLLEVIFVGDITSISKNTNDEYSFKAHDKAFRLNKNYIAKNFYNKLPSEVTKSLVAEIGLQVGTLPQDSVRCSFPAWNKTVYTSILTAYKIQHNQDNKIYSIVAEGEKISVIEQGTMCNARLVEGINIIDATYSKSIENIVNKVVLYKMTKDKPSIIGNKVDQESINKYGVFQMVQEQDKSNAVYLQVQSMLKKPEETANITVLGNTELVSGYSVLIKINALSNLNGLFYIRSDKHMWKEGSYTTSLELAFENVMNDIDVETYPQSKRKKKNEGATNVEDVTIGNV